MSRERSECPLRALRSVLLPNALPDSGSSDRLTKTFLPFEVRVCRTAVRPSIRVCTACLVALASVGRHKLCCSAALSRGMRAALSANRTHRCIALDELSLASSFSASCRHRQHKPFGRLILCSPAERLHQRASLRALEKVCADRYLRWRLEKNRR